jgi:alkylation response protein AidB-like acyl-CoA dehydrogenase
MAIRDRLPLSADERDLQATLREFLAGQFPATARRAAIDGDAGDSGELHARLVRELGLGGLTVPEDYGGLGLTATEASVVHTELGRALYGGPFLAGCLATAALASAAAGDPAGDAASRWLPGLASGELIATVAVAGPDGRWPAGHDREDATMVTAEPAAGSWRLTGTRWYVLAGQAAGLCVVPARSADGPGLYVTELPAPEISVEPLAGLDLTRRLSVLTFGGAPAVQIAASAAAHGALAEVRTAFDLAIAAEAAGGIAWCLDTAVSHAKERQQFGRPIGSFQAVAHQCADLLSDQQTASAAARYAAAATADGAPDAELAREVAVLRAGEGYRAAAEATIHILGGTGFTWEHDAHLYYRRAWSAQQLAGGAGAHRSAIARLAGLHSNRAHDT